MSTCKYGTSYQSDWLKGYDKMGYNLEISFIGNDKFQHIFSFKDIKFCVHDYDEMMSDKNIKEIFNFHISELRDQKITQILNEKN